MRKIGNLGIFSLIILGIFWPLNVPAATVRFDATVDLTELTVEDNLTLTLTLTSDGAVNDEEPSLSDLPGFEVLGKWNQSEASSVFVNGKFQFLRKQIYKYTLQPQKPGKLTIAPAEVVVKGQTLKTSPIQITVLAGGAKPRSNVAKNQNRRGRAGPGGQRSGRPPDDDEDLQNNPLGGLINDEDMDDFAQLLRKRGFLPDTKGGIKSQPMNDRDAFFISVEANKSKAYVGEEIIATWYIYTKGNIQAFDALKYPDLKGFWKEELEMATRLNFQSEVVNGIPYNRAVLVSYALFPIAAGKKLIDPFKAKATVIEMNSAMSVFGIGRPYTYVKTSKELPIEVLPLPTQGRPPSFSGAVGSFHITGSVSSAQVKANQPFSLKIRFQGEGNVKAIELPPLDLPKSVEVYDTKKESQFMKSGQGFKEFEVLLIPRAVGDLTIPPLTMSYFDPKTTKYVVQNTPSFKVNVVPGDGSAPNLSVPMAQGNLTNPVTSAPKDIRFLKTSSTLGISPKVKKVVWGSLFLGTALIFAWLFFNLKRFDPNDLTDVVKRRVKEKMKVARLKLKLGDSKGVGVECSNAVLATLGEVTGSGGSLPAQDLITRLPKNSEKLNKEIINYLSLCEILSFAPSEISKGQTESSDMKEVVTRAEKIIAELFEQN